MLGPRQRRLVERLETYEGKQGYGSLECGDERCALGVAVRLAMEEGVNLNTCKLNGHTYFNTFKSYLPQSVAAYFGFYSWSGSNSTEETSVLLLNDSKRLTFKEIAAELRSGRFFKEVK